MGLKTGILKSFSAAGYTAVVAMTGSDRAFLEDVGVARNIGSAEMIAGRRVAVFFPDEHNARDAVVVAVYV